MGVIPDNIYLGAYWGARRETAESCAKRSVEFLTRLGEIHPAFETWYYPPGNPRSRVELTLPIISSLFQAGAHFADDGTLLADIGFTIYLLWGPGEYAGHVSITCGGYCSVMANSCVVTVPVDHVAAREITEPLAMTRLLTAAVDYWSPDWATVCHDRLFDLLAIRLPGPQLGMATFLGSTVFSDIPDLPPPSKRIDLPGHGSIILFTEEPFSLENKLHLKSAKHVKKILRRHGVFKVLPREWA